MYFRIAFIVITLFSTQQIYSQDLIELKNGDLIEAKVLEVSIETVKYQLKAKTGDGPVYTVETFSIKQIQYSTGQIENFSNFSSEVCDLSKKHLIGFNYFDFIARNVSFDYEYFFTDERDFSLYIPLRVGLPGNSNHAYWENIVETGVGIFVYPFRQKKVNFYTGLESAIAIINSTGYTWDYNTQLYTYTDMKKAYMGAYITNGFKFNFRERIGLGYSFGVGLFYNLMGSGTEFRAKGNMSFFYRF